MEKGREKLVKLEQNQAQIVREEQSLETSILDVSKYVASSRGKYFYEVGSDRGNSLSEKNRIYFSSQEEAEKLGFKPYFDNWQII